MKITIFLKKRYKKNTKINAKSVIILDFHKKLNYSTEDKEYLYLKLNFYKFVLIILLIGN